MVLKYLDNGYAVIFGALSLHMFLGSVLQIGSIMTYALSYFRLQNGGVAKPEIIFLVFPIQTATFAFTSPFGYKSIIKLGTRKTAALGAFIILISLLAATFVTSQLWFLLLFGFFNGIGSGIAYMVPVAVGWRYFPRKKGLISGLTSCAFAYSGFTFSIISNRLINPQNIKPDIPEQDGQVTYYYFNSQVANKFPVALRWECLMWLALIIIAVVLIRSPSLAKKAQIMANNSSSHNKAKKDELKESFLLKGVDQVNEQDQDTQIEIQIDEHDFTLLEILSTKQFWQMYVMGFFSIFLGFFMISAYKNYGATLRFNDAFLSFSGAIAFGVGGAFRLLLGSLLECLSFKTVYGFLIVVQVRMMSVKILVCCTMDMLSIYKPIFLIYVSLAIMFQGAHMAMFPAGLTQIYGAKSAKFAFSVLFSSLALSSLIGGMVNGYLLPLIGFTNIFYICGGFSAISLVMLYFFNPVNHAKKAVASKQV